MKLGQKLDQTKAPIFEALDRYKRMRVLPFDVPGHKQGRGNDALREFLGNKCMSVDVNSMKPLDNLMHPTSVIKEAEELAAEAFGADCTFFMVNGTSSSVQAMLMSALKENDEVIMPRNVHKSAINSLILIGAIPIYINPGIHTQLGISLGMDTADVIKAMDEHPNAKAVFLNNPTYYGICTDLKTIIQEAHKRNMLVLVDEAHGTHFYFGENLPPAAMHLGADMAAVSIHKTGGSLTQSSILLVNTKRVRKEYVRTIINLTQTTSASYLLLCSLDITRKNLALNGKDTFSGVTELSNYARTEINKIGRYYAFSREMINGNSIFDFDTTKLSIHTRDVGLAGIEVYDLLRDEYNIQIELGDTANILAIISVGDNLYAIERLIAALTEIKRRYEKDSTGLLDHEYIDPQLVLTPKEAFYATTRTVPLAESVGLISCEFIMCYPPGIPILAPGERITADILNYITYAKEKGALLTGSEDMKIENINVYSN